MSDRLTGLITLVAALAFFISALRLESPFFADPLGPSAFPILISAVAGLAGMVMLLRPDAEPEWPAAATARRLVLATGILVFYAFGLKPLGFLLSTAVAAAALSYQIRASAARAAVTGICLSVGLFIIFKFALGLSLFALPRWLTG